MFFLGIHYGQFPEYWGLSTESPAEPTDSRVLSVEGKSVRGVSGMTLVVPCWKIIDLLKLPKHEEFRQQRAKLLSAFDALEDGFKKLQADKVITPKKKQVSRRKKRR